MPSPRPGAEAGTNCSAELVSSSAASGAEKTGSCPVTRRKYHFSRENARPFTERDLLTMQLLRPHLIALYREAARRRHEPVRLTPRELDVLRAVANGLSTEDIAGQLVVSTSTVRKHLENTYRKLGVSSRTAALARVFPDPDLP